MRGCRNVVGVAVGDPEVGVDVEAEAVAVGVAVGDCGIPVETTEAVGVGVAGAIIVAVQVTVGELVAVRVGVTVAAGVSEGVKVAVWADAVNGRASEDSNNEAATSCRRLPTSQITARRVYPPAACWCGRLARMG